MQPYIIASYPRSGSTWFRFILCYLFYPTIPHTFDSVNRHIPPIDHEPGLLNSILKPVFFKSHGIETATSIILIHRHVGDVLESEWWYKKKIHGDKRDLRTFLNDCEWGKEWRTHIDHYFPAVINIPYEEIGKPGTYIPFTRLMSLPTKIEDAIGKASIEKMRKLEMHGFGEYPTGDPEIPFCRAGKTGQWWSWAPDLKEILLEENKLQLRMLGYA